VSLLLFVSLGVLAVRVAVALTDVGALGRLKATTVLAFAVAPGASAANEQVSVALVLLRTHGVVVVGQTRGSTATVTVADVSG
jgi:hypothetical protein